MPYKDKNKIIQWQKNNPQSIYISKKKYKDKNIDKFKSWRAKYRRKIRNIKLSIDGQHTNGEWELLKKQYGNKCPCCKKFEPEIKLTEDHIVPVTKGGSDWIENIQPLCISCNSRKHTKTIFYEF